MAQFFPVADRFEVITPLGPGQCWGWEPTQADTEWLVWQTRTGEPFWWRNKHVRRAPSVTNGLYPVSPFTGLNAETIAHVNRYKALGALPDDYDLA
jgi:hypothetical protein